MGSTDEVQNGNQTQHGAWLLPKFFRVAVLLASLSSPRFLFLATGVYIFCCRTIARQSTTCMSSKYPLLPRIRLHGESFTLHPHPPGVEQTLFTYPSRRPRNQPLEERNAWRCTLRHFKPCTRTNAYVRITTTQGLGQGHRALTYGLGTSDFGRLRGTYNSLIHVPKDGELGGGYHRTGFRRALNPNLDWRVIEDEYLSQELPVLWFDG